MTLLYLLLAAHLIGDFVLQPKSWVDSKYKNGVSASGLWKHFAVHFLLILLIGFAFPQYYIGLIIVFVAHIIIDIIKVEYLKRFETSEKTGIIAFMMDQLAHFVVIVLVVNYDQNFIDWNMLSDNNLLLISLGYLFVTLPASSIIRVLISPYSKEIEKLSQTPEKANWKNLFTQKEVSTDTHQSLKSGGMYIGILERLLVFTFILIGQWSAVGFLITAKSVFRFGDLNKGKNRAFTEYVLIGTLLSFGFAIVAAIVVKALLN